MLKQRILTAIIMVAVLLAAILWLPAAWFNVFVSVIVVAGAWEWTALSGLQARTSRIAYTLGFAAMALLLPMLAVTWLPWLLVPALLWWLLALNLVRSFPRSEPVLQRRWLLLTAGLLVLVPGWFGLMYLRTLPQYRFYILWFITLVAAADI